jgi:hypothetical protein
VENTLAQRPRDAQLARPSPTIAKSKATAHSLPEFVEQQAEYVEKGMDQYDRKKCNVATYTSRDPVYTM